MKPIVSAGSVVGLVFVLATCGSSASNPTDGAADAAAGSADIGGAAAGSGGAGATGVAGGAAGAAAGTGGAGATAGAGSAGAGGMKVACDLLITEASGSNVGFTEFAAKGAQGSTRTSQTTNVQSQGIHAQVNVANAARALDLTVAGPTPTVGSTYAMETIDSTLAPGQGAIVFTIVDGPNNYTWDPVPGGTLTVSAIGPGVISSYYNATFKLEGFQFTPRPAATANKAAGTFKMSGECLGAITK